MSKQTTCQVSFPPGWISQLKASSRMGHTVEVCENCYLESEWIDKGLRYKSKQSPSPGTDDLFFMIRKKWLTLVKVVD